MFNSQISQVLQHLARANGVEVMIYASCYTRGHRLSPFFLSALKKSVWWISLKDEICPPGDFRIVVSVCTLFLLFVCVDFHDVCAGCVCCPNAVCYLPGCVYSLGRAEYGRLGLGQGAEEKSEPTPVPGLGPSTRVACGASVSYAITKEGERHC